MKNDIKYLQKSDVYHARKVIETSKSETFYDVGVEFIGLVRPILQFYSELSNFAIQLRRRGM